MKYWSKMASSPQQQNSSLKLLDRFTKTGTLKKKRANQSQNSLVTGFGVVGNLVPFASVSIHSSTNGISSDQVDSDMCISENFQNTDTRRPSLNSIDSASSSSMKMKLSKSFSRSSEESDISFENSSLSSGGSSRWKTSKVEKGGKKSKLRKDISESIHLIRKNSWKQNNSLMESMCSVSSNSSDQTSPSLDECLSSMHENSYIENVLMELLNTEKSYVRDLKDIIKGYMVPLMKNNIFSEYDVKAIFSTIKSIFSFNRKFLKSLTEQQADAVQVSQLFLDKEDGFGVYTSYCTNFSKSIEILESYVAKPEHNAFIKDCQKFLKHPLPLQTYLFKPVQRILKYHLLLRNISDHYEEGAPGYDVVCGAYKCMLTVASNINEVKRIEEKQSRLVEIWKCIQGLGDINVHSLGELVLEGRFTWLGSKEDLHVLLLKKGILITKRRKDSVLVFKTLILCSSLTLVEIIPRETLAFQVMGYDCPKNQCTLMAYTQDQKRLWCREIKTIILDSIKAAVPEKARMLLMLPGGHQDTDADEKSRKQKFHRKLSINLDRLNFNLDNKSPKTSTPINPFFRSKLRKTALAKFSTEKKSKSKRDLSKRRSRSLENLRKVSNLFHDSGIRVDTPRCDLEQNESVNKSSSKINLKEKHCNNSSGETDFWSDANSSDQNTTSPLPSKPFNRAASFKQAVNENNVCRVEYSKPRISYSRSLSAAYSSSSDDDDDDDDIECDVDEMNVECSDDKSEGIAISMVSGDLKLRSDSLISLKSSRNNSTVTLSSIAVDDEEEDEEDSKSVNSTALRTPHYSSDEEVATQMNEYKNHWNGHSTSENEISSFVGIKKDTTYTSLPEYVDHIRSSDERSANIDYVRDIDHPQTINSGSGADTGTGFGDIVDYCCSPSVKRKALEFEQILRKKNISTISEEGNYKKRSLLKRKSAFCRDKKQFIPRRSTYYTAVEEQRKASLPIIYATQNRGSLETYPEGKLSLSDDSLPFSPLIDDDEMIEILLAAAEEETKVDSNDEEQTTFDRVEEEGSEVVLRPKKGQNTEDKVEESAVLPTNRNSGVVGLIELIASCMDLSGEFNESYEKIKLMDEANHVDTSHLGENIPRDNNLNTHSNHSKSPQEVKNEEISISKLSEERKLFSNPLFRNKHHSYVFRLARAYSNRFKKMSTSSSSEQLSSHSDDKHENNDWDCDNDDSQKYLRQETVKNVRKSSHFVDPAMEHAEKSGIVKQRIKQFQSGTS